MKISSSFSIAQRPGFLILLMVLFFNSTQILAQQKKAVKSTSDLSYLTDSTVLNRSDYLLRLGKVFETINQVEVTTSSFYLLEPIAGHLKQDEAAIALLKKRLSQGDRTLNVQNLQMYQTLLDELETNNVRCLADLQDYEKKLNGLKTQILNLRKDTVLMKIFRTDSLKRSFKTEFAELGKKRIIMDSLIKSNTSLINSLQARTSANIINIRELTYTADNQLESVSIKAFSKERRYLWESVDKAANKKVDFQRFMESEQQVSGYYFEYTRGSRFLLIVLGAAFFFWLYFNFKSLKQRNRLDSVNHLNFTFVRPKPYLISLIFILTLAPVFDLLAPALYIETIHVLLAFSITALFFKRLPRDIFYKWCIFVVLLVFPIILRSLGMPARYQRWLLLIFGIASLVYGLYSYKILKEKAVKYRLLKSVGIIYIIFNFLAIICNLFGRFTLTQIFYSSAVNSALHAISLIILAGMITEAFLLQIKSSRVRKDYPEHFDWEPVVKSLRGLLGIAVFLIWLTLLLVNLNIFDSLYTSLIAFLNEKRQIGTLIFTFWGIGLFLIIIWIANFLQKYIAYFFGDTGDDSLDDNKSERSKLIVTKLILLIGGFLIAVAASGLPLDKITVVLGALGVGIGLGLQNIVSNFVSGIILIFDKTVRIGDVVEISDKKGKVKEIGLRASTLLTDDGAEIIIPNGAILSNNIINWTLTNNQMRVVIEFSVSNPFQREEVTETIKEIIATHDNIFVAKEPKIIIIPKNKNSSGIKIYFWCKDISQAENTKSSINSIIFDELEAKGIEVL
ncbi:mechanosensitive ion channel protein [Pedobacter lusitanus]|uniref:Mechanosensitive ion channel protein n=1 Tax=Pedobacter lusitanus TaxID=1503925 RepID=A0A0D0GWZ6_9SPHI|nr:mechanosensitive ion channel domain-containing protein [Pedobacter lusitanus]KIO78956.1 mechanosensitive ion channel protein [Pedobacter lusitanus]